MSRCNLCGSEQAFGLHTFGKRKILCCASCSLIYTDPATVDLHTRYDDSYSAMIRNDFRLDMPHEEYARLMLQKIGAFKRPGRLLDIGCGPGVFLAEARRRGWQGCGVELTEGNFRYATEILRLDVRKGTIEEAGFQDGSFDVITMWDVIEHIPDPSGVLAKIRRLLKDDGLLCIETPNAGSIYRKILGKRWIGFAEPSHIFAFDRKTLAALLEKTGFQTARIETANVNFFSAEGIRRFRLHGYLYNLKLILRKLAGKDSADGSGAKKPPSARGAAGAVTKAINYPTDLLINSLSMGDQLRIFARKNV